MAMSASLIGIFHFGALEIGSFVGVFLFGVVFLQSFNYYNMYPDDGWGNKTLVRSEVILYLPLINHPSRWPQFCMSKYSKALFVPNWIIPQFFFCRICEIAHTVGLNYEVYRVTIMYYGKIEALIVTKTTVIASITLFGGLITLLVQVRKIKYILLYTN